MCASCGKDLTQSDYIGINDTTRATVSMAHDTLGLTVSLSEASRLEKETTKRLLRQSNLSLIVDLDQTIIHAAVDPTIGDWQNDSQSLNHEAVKDVASFRLPDEGPNGNTYYVKQRPGLQSFLDSVSRKYEMHVYTMGTRSYAIAVAKIIDPTGKFFGDRILSRDESGSLTQKTVERLFPVDTNMVVVIDDRADVWNWIPNLVKVVPYEFFIGIGDINSSFLPQKEAIVSERLQTLVPSADKANQMTAVESSDANILEQSAAKVAIQHGEQMAKLELQVIDRPLAKKQQDIDSDDKCLGSESAEKRGLLVDNDGELLHLEQALKEIHKTFYAAYAEQVGSVFKDRTIFSLNGNHRSAQKSLVADVKVIIPDLKREVLQGVSLLFSGLIPLNQDPRSSEIGQLCLSFGARLVTDIKHKPSHLVAKKGGTLKVRTAQKYSSVHVVTPEWLLESISCWQRKLEADYLLSRHLSDTSSLTLDPIPEIMVSSGGEASGTDASTLTDNGVSDRIIDEEIPKMNWADAKKEMDDFLGDISDGTTEVSGEDSETDHSRAIVPVSPRSLKRSRDGLYVHDASDMDPKNNDLLKSPLSKRRQTAKQRKSRLVNSMRAISSSESDSLPIGIETQTMPEVTQEPGTNADSSDMDQFADELAAGLDT